MIAAGYDVAGPALYGPRGFRDSLPETERRLKVLTRQRADAQAALDAVLRTDEEQATRDAEDAVFYATMKTMQCNVDSTGTGFVAFTTDGDPLDVADMTHA